MKKITHLQVVFVICLLSYPSLAQKSDSVRISPKLVAEVQNGECASLRIGQAAISTLPKYPTEAKSARVGGKVKVKVQVDEEGNVARILGINGHKLLQESAANAASKIKFSPTICDGIPKPITGYVTYNYSPYVFTESYFVAKTIEDFTDIDRGSSYYESILYLTENYQLAFGYRDRKFHPKAPITKGEFAHFVRTTLDMLSRRAKLANKVPDKIGLFNHYNPNKVRSIEEIVDINLELPYAKSVDLLVSEYDVALVNESKAFVGKLPLTQNEIIDYWVKLFGEDAVPVNFKTIEGGDRIFSRGEFALFLHESLYVLTYKVIP